MNWKPSSFDEEASQTNPGGDPLQKLADMRPWKVLIVDDDEEIHHVTRFALKRFTFAGRAIQFVSAYSAKEGMDILDRYDDIAVALVDVVMEADDAGLRLVRHIRRVLNNKMIRIILRTGQPGMAPEQDVVVDYDINDYKEKTELTSQRLHTALITALRSYQDLMILDTNRQGLQQIIDSSAAVFKVQSLCSLASYILTGLQTIINLNQRAPRAPLTGLVAVYSDKGILNVVTASGDLQYLIGQNLRHAHLPSRQILDDLLLALQEGQSQYCSNRLVVFFPSSNGEAVLIYLEGIRKLNEWDRRIVQVFCSNTHIAFENMYLRNEVEGTQREIIFKLGEAIEVRSFETGNHVKRVAEVVRILGHHYGLSSEDMETLGFATPIHDIGKLAVPDAILNKPGKLTPEEFEIIKHHTTIGYEMLKSSKRPIIQAGAVIAQQHHERYDGCGYPLGLKGEKIHIFGRIVALADVFDALGSHRVYKEAWPIDRIVEYIAGQRGAQFDPSLTDIFLEHIEELTSIRTDLPD